MRFPRASGHLFTARFRLSDAARLDATAPIPTP
jgi:hypothetical protein